MAADSITTSIDVLELVRRTKVFRRVVGALRGDESEPGHVGGCHGALLSILLTAAARSAETLPPILVLLPEEAEVLGLVRDLEILAAPAPVRLVGRRASGVERARGIAEWCAGGSRMLAASVESAMDPLPRRADLSSAERSLRVGGRCAMDEFTAALGSAGFERTAVVSAAGQFAVRGDLVDVFDRRARLPLRVEVFDDVVEGLRRFDPVSQIFVETLTVASVWLEGPDGPTGDGALAEYLSDDTVVVLRDPRRIEQMSAAHQETFLEDARPAARARMEALRRFREIVVTRVRGPAESAINLGSQVVTAEGHSFEAAVRTLERVTRGKTATLFCFDGATERERFFAALRATDAPAGASDVLRRTVIPLDGPLSEGFSSPLLGIAAVSHHELFAVTRAVEASPEEVEPPLETRPLDTFLDLAEGDFVVHLVHGIARFMKLERTERGGAHQDFLVLEFRDDVHVHVPTAKIDLVQKYVGGRGEAPELSKVGSGSFQKKKAQVADAVTDLAADLLELSAVRARAQGIAHPADTQWQQAFEAAFPHQETPDQLTSIEAIKRDLESPRPMDRLLCGDVGYGKTELAMRAAFKCVMGGRQVAVLVPTTILAHQHAETFRERMADFPVTVESLSRFRTERQVKQVLEGVTAGHVDVLIGTHRLLQDDVVFRELGLLIVDEEQRFGVVHKEKLRKLRRNLDVLSLSATPIPRTLHQSMVGIRDIATLRQAPAGRRPVHSEVSEWSPALVRAGIMREVERHGQVFFIHNRVQTIHRLVHQLQQLVPEASFVVGHGQMGERELERVMNDFVHGRATVLVSTTIVESGLHIPRANTIFVDRAEMYGLSDLHQLRGRVGRSEVQAFAYFLVRADVVPTEVAQKRLHAIEEFNHLGAGFQLALRDLEIRGAGNLLGPEQSGHIASVGYDLYCRLLDMAVKRLKNERIVSPEEIELFLDFDAYVPEDYVTDRRLRIEIYRKLGRCRVEDDFRTVIAELRDRFGPAPAVVEEFVHVARIRAFMERERISRLELLKGEGPMLRAKNLGALCRRVKLDPRLARVVGGNTLLLVHPQPFSGPRELLDFLQSSLTPLASDGVAAPATYNPRT